MLAGHADASSDHRYALNSQLLRVGLLVPCLWLLVGAALLSERTELREALTPVTMRAFLLAGLGSALASLVLDHLRLWPWLWRWRVESNVRSIAFFLESHQWSTLLLWVIIGGVLIPVIEEIVFRFGVLRLILSVTGSRRMAIVVSAAVFGLAHLGPATPIWASTYNALWAGFFGLVLGTLVARNGGRLDMAIGAHVFRSLTEIAYLVVAVMLHGRVWSHL